MSLIKKEVKVETEKSTFRLPKELLERLAAYSEFLSSSRDHIVTQALEYVLGKDPEFSAHLTVKTVDGSVDKSVDKIVDRKVARAGGDAK